MAIKLVGGYCFACDIELNAEQAQTHNHEEGHHNGR